jgi:hypothetical protein
MTTNLSRGNGMNSIKTVILTGCFAFRHATPSELQVRASLIDMKLVMGRTVQGKTEHPNVLTSVKILILNYSTHGLFTCNGLFSVLCIVCCLLFCVHCSCYCSLFFIIVLVIVH